MEVGNGVTGAEGMLTNGGIANPYKEFLPRVNRQDDVFVERRRKLHIKEDITEGRKHVNEKLLTRSISSLVVHLRRRKAKMTLRRRSIAGSKESIYVLMVLKKLRDFCTKERPLITELPHPLHSIDAKTTLFVREPKGNVRRGFILRRKRAEQSNITIVTMKTVRQRHTKAYFERLLKESKVFFCDSRIWRALARVFGSQYYKRFAPIPVKLQGKDWAKQCWRASRLSFLTLSRSHTLAMKVANLPLSNSAIEENVIVAANSMATQLFPGRKWRAIKAVYIQSDESTAFPIYHCDKDVLKPLLDKIYKNKTVENATFS
eukprot:CAMPEP_0167743992 /NCGR_PEP_ID=MMETSP0110_2-20121227/2326_1 /TAXON_ID=629695 /ORGANISM="Gymnochlora sp., Strain CCMP2014" /LENGTH=317 /DNA_ID=CAMNT_0007628429 /DNA_START=73 /DNA_END=1027 /DNA_ORIENTATION=-